MKKIFKIVWKDKYQTGSSEGDRLKIKLLAAYNDIVEIFTMNYSSNDFRYLLNRIVAQTTVYFDAEEEFSKVSNIDVLESHLLLHDEFLYDLELYYCDISSKSKKDNVELLMYVQRWLKMHIDSHQYFLSGILEMSTSKVKIA